MKKLITTNSGGHLISLDDFRHTQEGVSESINSFAKSLIPEGADRCILHGCVLTVAGSAFSLSAGAIYYQGEVYQVNAQNGTTNGLAYWVISVTYAALNPITYQDGVSHSVHQIRQAVLQYFPGAPDAGAFAFTTTLKLSDLFTATLNASVILDLTYDIGDWKFCNNLAANFDLTTGLAKPGSKYAGKWAIANGNHGTQNMAGRVPVGFDPSQTEFNLIGKAGGVKEVTLDTSQIPSHTHGSDAPKGSSTNTFSGGSSAEKAVRGTPPGGSGQFATINNAGGGQAHTNLQPYRVAGFIQKIA